MGYGEKVKKWFFDEEGDDVTNDIFVGAKAELEKTVWMIAAELGQAPGL